MAMYEGVCYANGVKDSTTSNGLYFVEKIEMKLIKLGYYFEAFNNESINTLFYDIEKMFNDKGVNITHKEILSGTPSQEIIKYITRENIDLVVCGIHERKKLSKFLLSSVSKRVLENAKSDVLIVR